MQKKGGLVQRALPDAETNGHGTDFSHCLNHNQDLWLEQKVAAFCRASASVRIFVKFTRIGHNMKELSEQMKILAGLRELPEATPDWVRQQYEDAKEEIQEEYSCMAQVKLSMGDFTSFEEAVVEEEKQHQLTKKEAEKSQVAGKANRWRFELLAIVAALKIIHLVPAAIKLKWGTGAGGKKNIRVPYAELELDGLALRSYNLLTSPSTVLDFLLLQLDHDTIFGHCFESAQHKRQRSRPKVSGKEGEWSEWVGAARGCLLTVYPSSSASSKMSEKCPGVCPKGVAKLVLPHPGKCKALYRHIRRHAGSLNAAECFVAIVDHVQFRISEGVRRLKEWRGLTASVATICLEADAPLGPVQQAHRCDRKKAAAGAALRLRSLEMREQDPSLASVPDERACREATRCMRLYDQMEEAERKHLPAAVQALLSVPAAASSSSTSVSVAGGGSGCTTQATRQQLREFSRGHSLHYELTPEQRQLPVAERAMGPAMLRLWDKMPESQRLCLPRLARQRLSAPPAQREPTLDKFIPPVINPCTGGPYPTRKFRAVHVLLVVGGIKNAEATSTDGEGTFNSIRRQQGAGKWNSGQEQKSYEATMPKNRTKELVELKEVEKHWAMAGKLQAALVRGLFWECDLMEMHLLKKQKGTNGSGDAAAA